MDLYTFGRVIYADKYTGEVLYDSPEVKTTDPDYLEKVRPYETIKALAERLPETVLEIRLEIGQYADDFLQGLLVRVDPETKQLYFTYPDPEEPSGQTPPQLPLTEQVRELRERQDSTEAAILALMDVTVMG